jgi:hypothetical protein
VEEIRNLPGVREANIRIISKIESQEVLLFLFLFCCLIVEKGCDELFVHFGEE